MRIGITIDTNTQSIWSNGLNQNAIFLCQLFNKLNYQSDLIINTDTSKRMVSEIKNLTNLNTVTATDSFKIRYDIIICLGYFIGNDVYDVYLKNNGSLKLVYYKCGNSFIMDSESILFNHYEANVNKKDHNLPKPDQIWVIPQMEKTNLQYYSFLHRQYNSTVVPFIWNPIAIEFESNKYGLPIYQKKDINNIAIMEPNISIMKNVLLPITIVDLHLELGYEINKILMFGSDNIKTNPRLLNILNRSKLLKENKITAESRQPTPHILKNYADVVLSWQLENNLNYLYLDVAWMGYPIIHNANLCSDIGYYYEDFDIKMGQEMLNKVINNHNNDEDYLNRNRNLINRYTINNDIMVKQYDTLLENLMSNKFIKYSYDKDNNTII